MYYSRLFPYQLLYSWLSYDPSTAKPGNSSSSSSSAAVVSKNATSSSSTFPRREFSMTIEPTPGNEVYIRYQSFLTQEELTSAIQKRRPTKLDIGAVFNYPPKDNKSLPSGKLQTQERELVFDIDLTDYDGVRNCGCSGAKICPKCWTFMGMAMEVMDEGLKNDFGFEHVAWFYSGRRGVHCWVCDDGARKLTNEARSAVATYFEVCTSLCIIFLMLVHRYIYLMDNTKSIPMTMLKLNEPLTSLSISGEPWIRKEQELSSLQSPPPHAFPFLPNPRTSIHLQRPTRGWARTHGHTCLLDQTSNDVTQRVRFGCQQTRGEMVQGQRQFHTRGKVGGANQIVEGIDWEGKGGY